MLAATVVLPGFAQAWRRTGDALSEMKHFSSAVEFYEVAIRLDSSFSSILTPTIERLKTLENIVENAETEGWPMESIVSLIEGTEDN